MIDSLPLPDPRTAGADLAGAPGGFPPTRAAALERLAAVDRAAYERTRNRLDGAVTRLSPYLTHGVLSVPEALEALRARGATLADKLVFELGWREYWQHAWRHLGEDLWTPRRAQPGLGNAPVPADVRAAATGVRVIDASVAALHRDGWLHNHARMWLAAWLVHERGTDWRAGAAWMHAHLLDGDLASNTLSWQWVAGTWTGRPYRWTDANVALNAPPLAGHGAVPPTLAEPPVDAEPPFASDALPPLAGRRVALVHPWMLRGRPAADVAIGIVHRPHHARHPWSARRWQFVTALARACTDALWVGDLQELAAPLARAAEVRSEATLAPGYRESLAALGVALDPAPRAFPDPDRLALSFSAWWHAFAPAPRRR